jgi:hypothetical protein
MGINTHFVTSTLTPKHQHRARGGTGVDSDVGWSGRLKEIALRRMVVDLPCELSEVLLCFLEVSELPGVSGE